jgi:hypothetical protein
MDFGSIGSLSSLLDDSRQAQEEREKKFNQKPGAVSGTTVVKRGAAGAVPDPNTKPVEQKDTKTKQSTSSIWDETEIPTEDALLDVRDGRPTPRYEFAYKQAVGTEDTFLGLGDKTPLSQDCTHLVVKIHFPGSTMKELDLDVTKNRIMAASRTHRLFTYLPCDVDDSNGKAQFDSKKEVLTVTLPILREF